MKNFLITLCVALCYFPFNYQMFSYINFLTGKKPPAWKWCWLTFFGNFLLFMIVSYMNFLLMLNWMIIAVFFVLEVRFLYGSSMLVSLSCGLQGGLTGLAVNLVTRSAAALLLNLPMLALDSRYHALNWLDNYKHYPIAVGFLFAALLFWWLRRRFPHLEVHESWHPSEDIALNLRFSAQLLLALFLYLALNLFIYSTPANDLAFKLWGMKSGICALIGFYIGLRYLDDLTRLKRFELQGRKVREALAARRGDDEALEKLAYTDFLTGAFNRQYSAALLEKFFARGESFQLCFVDLNLLKRANDIFGHDAGDRYISAAAQALKSVLRTGDDFLCRYGGDEFLLVLHKCTAKEAARYLAEVDRTLGELSCSSEYPFVLSVSYGIADSHAYQSAETLIQAADAQMYEHKAQFRKRRQIKAENRGAPDK